MKCEYNHFVCSLPESRPPGLVTDQRRCCLHHRLPSIEVDKCGQGSDQQQQSPSFPSSSLADDDNSPSLLTTKTDTTNPDRWESPVQLSICQTTPDTGFIDSNFKSSLLDGKPLPQPSPTAAAVVDEQGRHRLHCQSVSILNHSIDDAALIDLFPCHPYRPRPVIGRRRQRLQLFGQRNATQVNHRHPPQAHRQGKLPVLLRVHFCPLYRRMFCVSLDSIDWIVLLIDVLTSEDMILN